jgi:integrase
MARLTKRTIDALQPKPSGDRVLWDDALKGFGVRMKPSGAASWIVQYRTRQGRSERHTFGKVGTLTPEEARTEARALLAGVARGEYPRSSQLKAREALTVAQLCERYLEAARAGLVTTRFRTPKRPSTIVNDEGRIARHIVPLIGRKPAGSLTRPDVQRMADAIAAGATAGRFKTKARGKAVVEGGASTAARTVELIGGIWSWAEKRGYVSGPSPARGVEKQRSAPKDRTLATGELSKLGAAMRVQEGWHPMAVAALRLIALTGLRREEACGLRWQEIDLDGHCLRLEATKTGRSTRPIGKGAVEHLRTLPCMHDELVFPSRNGSARADLKKSIAAIFDAADLKDARSHDLRRTFASTAAELGYGDATIAELIGHARRGVTERHYVRRPDTALVAAATRVAQVVADALEGRRAEVVELRSAIAEFT